MDIYNLKSFQEKVARFSVSPYAEAITTLAGLSPQIVGTASRLASAYASLRGTVQLLTTDEDNNIVDETTEAREVIAQSAIVSAWNNIGSAVERLISLRKSLAANGVLKVVKSAPTSYTAGTSFVGCMFPCIIPKSNNMSNGYVIIVPKDWYDYSFTATNGSTTDRFLVLSLVADPPYISKVLNTNPSVGKPYAQSYSDNISRGSVSIAGAKPIMFILRVADTPDTLTVRAVYHMVLKSRPTSGPTVYEPTWLKSSSEFSRRDDAFYYSIISQGVSTSETTQVESDTLFEFIDSNMSNIGPITWMKKSTAFSFPAASDENIAFDPLDPYEVFTQAYQAADAILTLMEDMGYSSGLSSEDRSLLS